MSDLTLCNPTPEFDCTAVRTLYLTFENERFEIDVLETDTLEDVCEKINKAVNSVIRALVVKARTENETIVLNVTSKYKGMP